MGFGCRGVSIHGNLSFPINTSILDGISAPQAPILGVSGSPGWLAGQAGGPTVSAACPGRAGWLARISGKTFKIREHVTFGPT